MDLEALAELFEKYEDEYIEFERVDSRQSERRDLHAFILLDRLQPGGWKIIGAAEHDQIWLDVDCEKLAEVITEAQVLELVRCGVRYDVDNESLSMFC